MKQRVQAMYQAWYQPDARMTREEWLYIAAMVYTCFMSFWIAFFIAWIIV